ncbi:hydroxyphenylacetyl-CoA thioesterase PaaI [Reichenbachiella carrageenanivorans]|uniref:Hydroxyphenylacetyl-CoA thioesterase PaaI n=1 Tax=Reichenbachiella carrageenanivorans TaxID=2979869 RepID=A0ABY6CYB3_9BACT|nr:hydroxyphenylacetyl-CoA thioesterase PaaI [Reichenbachiella carrageenanivorans]UXX78863.1 hydroxyphenylacetyl-CoA thioesterase PaaI [Reichenbachiella carrageenanivorans]
MTNPKSIVKHMLTHDTFSQWLGIRLEKIELGFSQICMTVTGDMLNGFGIAHGGITYALADSAFAFAANSQGKHAISIETSISHTKAVHEGDLLTAIAKEENLSNRLGIYSITVTNQHHEIVALFKGTVFRKDTHWSE